MQPGTLSLPRVTLLILTFIAVIIKFLHSKDLSKTPTASNKIFFVTGVKE